MKRVVAVLLSVAMLALCGVPAAAKAEPAQQNTHASDAKLPLVLVRGMDFTGLVKDAGSENPQPAIGGVEAKKIVKAVFKAGITGLAHFSREAAVEVLLETAEDILGSLACKPDGTSKYDVSYPSYPESLASYPELWNRGDGHEEGILKSSVERLGADYTYYYTYDWRMNPLDCVDRLEELIDTALQTTGCEKVNVVCASMGGMHAVAYLEKYGYSKLASCIFLSSAFCGADVATDCMTGNVEFPEEALFNFVASKTDGTLLALVKLMKKAGLFGLASRLANGFVERSREQVYGDFMRSVFGYALGFWALVEPEGYDAAVNLLFDGAKEENAEFIQKTARLQQLHARRRGLIEAAKSSGVKIAVVASYNTPLIPVYKSAVKNGDGTLETEPMSAGATVADYGKTLPADYAAADPSCISPDRVIDASTCLLPENTWFIKDGGHVSCDYGTDYAEFLFWLLGFDGCPTVESNEKYPRFMQWTGERTLSAVK